MHKFLKHIGFSVVLAGICLNSFACQEEQVDEAVVPEVYELIKLVYSGDSKLGVESGLSKMTKCSDIINYLKKPAIETKKKEACGEYTKALDVAKNVAGDDNAYKHLAENQMNSGYYTAAYILANDMLDDIVEICEESDKSTRAEASSVYIGVFKEGCGGFWDHAGAVANNRLLVRN